MGDKNTGKPKPSLIRTIPSALEFHQISHKRLAGFTAGGESHPAPEDLFFIFYAKIDPLSRMTNKIAACAKIIIGSPTIKFICFVLWRI